MGEHRGVTGDSRSQARGRRFENVAANHNRNEIQAMERELAKTGDPRSAMSWGPSGAENQKIGYSCSVCGSQQPGEMEHVGQRDDGTRYVAEAKHEDHFDPALDARQTRRHREQMTSLSEMAATQGMDVVYKVPKGNDIANEIADTARNLGLGNISVLPI